MSEISTLAAANFLTQAALPLIKAATIPRIHDHSSFSSNVQDRVSISSETKALHTKNN